MSTRRTRRATAPAIADSAREPAVPGEEEERDPVTGTTPQELMRLADEAYDQRDAPDSWEDEAAAEVDSRVRSVVSVRFNKGELGRIDEAARRTGIPVSTYIRMAALMAASSDDIDDVHRAVELLLGAHERLTRVRRHLTVERLRLAGT